MDLEFDLMFPCDRSVGDLVFLELKGNPNHDSRGRFARTGSHGDGGGGGQAVHSELAAAEGAHRANPSERGGHHVDAVRAAVHHVENNPTSPHVATINRTAARVSTARQEVADAAAAVAGTRASLHDTSIVRAVAGRRQAEANHFQAQQWHARATDTFHSTLEAHRTAVVEAVGRDGISASITRHAQAQTPPAAPTPPPAPTPTAPPVSAPPRVTSGPRASGRPTRSGATIRELTQAQEHHAAVGSERTREKLDVAQQAHDFVTNNPSSEHTAAITRRANEASRTRPVLIAARQAHAEAQAALDHATVMRDAHPGSVTRLDAHRAAQAAHAETRRALQDANTRDVRARRHLSAALAAGHAAAATADADIAAFRAAVSAPAPELAALAGGPRDAADRVVTGQQATQQAADHQRHLMSAADAMRQVRGGDPVHDRDTETAHHFVLNNPGSEHNARIARAAQGLADAHRRISTDTSPDARARLDDAHAELRARLSSAGLAVPADSSTPIQGWRTPRGATAPPPPTAPHPNDGRPISRVVSPTMSYAEGHAAIEAEAQRRTAAGQPHVDVDRVAAHRQHNINRVDAELQAARATLTANYTATGAARQRDAEAAHAFVMNHPQNQAHHAEHIARTAADVSAARVRWRANLDAGRGSDVSDMDTASARLRARLSDAGVRVPAAPAPPPPPAPTRAAPPRQTRPPEPQYTTPHSLADLHAVAPGRVSTSWSEAEFKQHWGKHFPNSSPAEVFGFMATGHRGFTIGSMHIGGGSDYVTYNIDGKAPNGDNAFRLERTYKAGNKEVHHDYFRLEKQYQGGGTAKVYLAHQLETAEANGYTHLTVFANIPTGTGGYTWARMGFRADSPTSFVRVAQGALHKLSSEERREVEGLLRQHARNPYITHAVATHVNPSKKAAYVAAANHEKALKASGTATASQLSQAKAATEQAELDFKVGKKLLLGTNWHGNVQLQDAQSRALYHDYLHGNSTD